MTNLDKIATHPLQTSAWAEFRKKWGNEILETEYGILTVHPLPFTSYKIGIFEKGLSPTKEMLSSLRKIGKENNLIFIKFGSLFSGLDIAKKINTIDKSARFIFYSESDQYAIDAYQFHPVDFLLEPISYDRLKDALERYYLESKTFLCFS